MAYRVELADRAARDLELLYLEKNAAESQAAARWYNRLEEAVSTLGRYPLSLPCCPGSSKDETKVVALALRQEAPRLSSHLRNR